MADENYHTERIEKYLAGEMLAEEKLNFEKDLASDNELKDAYKLHRNIVSHIEEEGNKDLKSFLKEIEHKDNIVKHPESKSGRVINLSKFVTAIAAGLAILVASVWLFRGNQSIDNNALFSQYYEAYPNQLTIIDRGEGNTSIIEETMTLYAKGDYQNAIMGIDKILTDNENLLVRDELLFYKALSLLSLDENSGAIDILNNLNSKEAFEYIEQVRWYEVLARLKEGNNKQIMDAANDLLNSKQTFKQNQTRVILSKINNDI